MAIHIHQKKKVSEKVEQQHRNRFRGSLVISLCTVFVLGLILWLNVFLLSKGDGYQFITYVEPRDTHQELEQSQQMSTKATQRMAIEDIQIEIITVDALSSFSVPTVKFDNMGEGSGNSDFGIGFTGLGSNGMGTGVGAGIGEGLGSSGSGMGSTVDNGSSFSGKLYDLKTYRNGKKSPLNSTAGNAEVAQLLSKFCNRNWSIGLLNKFKHSDTKLYLNAFFMPNCKDDEAPYAYKCSNWMQPSRWVAVYKGKVQAPKTGKFRFYGIGDSMMAVRFNRKNVLACGFHSIKNGGWNTHRREVYDRGDDVVSYDETAYWNNLFRWDGDGLAVQTNEGMLASFHERLKVKRSRCKPVKMKRTVNIYEDGPLDPGAQRRVVGTKEEEYTVRQCYGKPVENWEEFDYKLPMLDSLYALKHDLTEPSYLAGGLEPGEVFSVKAGQWYDFEMMVSEIGGGNFGFCLLIEEVGDGMQRKDSKGRPLFQLFRTAFVQPDCEEIYRTVHFGVDEDEKTFPPYDPDSLVWPARAN